MEITNFFTPESFTTLAAVKRLVRNKDVDGVPAGADMYRMAETELIPVLWKAVQQLSAKNDALEARIVALE